MNALHFNIFLGSKVLATYAGSGYVQSNWHFSLNDWVGTRRVQANADGVVEGSFQTMPFGDDLTTTGTPGATEHEFTGKVRDAESGNDYFPARYYASSAGRFLSPDWSAMPEPVPYASLSNPQSLNLFSYVTNSPLSRVDESGHGGGAGEFKGSCTSDLGSGDPYNDCMQEEAVQEMQVSGTTVEVYAQADPWPTTTASGYTQGGGPIRPSGPTIRAPNNTRTPAQTATQYCQQHGQLSFHIPFTNIPVTIGVSATLFGSFSSTNDIGLTFPPSAGASFDITVGAPQGPYIPVQVGSGKNLSIGTFLTPSGPRGFSGSFGPSIGSPVTISPTIANACGLGAGGG